MRPNANSTPSTKITCRTVDPEHDADLQAKENETRDAHRLARRFQDREKSEDHAHEALRGDDDIIPAHRAYNCRRMKDRTPTCGIHGCTVDMYYSTMTDQYVIMCYKCLRVCHLSRDYGLSKGGLLEWGPMTNLGYTRAYGDMY